MEEKLGCLGIGEQDTDFQLCNGNSDLLPKLFHKNELRFEYNQGKNKWSEVSCTIFAAMGMLSDLIDYKFSDKELKEVDELSYENPKYFPQRARGEGWYVRCAVDLVRDWYNNSELSKKYGKIASYRISKYDDEILEGVLNELYTIDGNFCPTSEYNKDRQDGMIDGTDFGNKTNGHSVDAISDNGQRSIKDSYYGRKYNIYGIKNKFSAMSNYGEFFYVYTLVKEDNYGEVKRLNEFKSSLLVAIEHNSKLRHLTNDKNYQAILHYTNEKHRKKIKDIDEQLAKYV